jgi:hypothetical protein
MMNAFCTFLYFYSVSECHFYGWEKNNFCNRILRKFYDFTFKRLTFGAGGVVQVIEYLLCKREALSSNHSSLPPTKF